jgi:hypothetical protein
LLLRFTQHSQAFLILQLEGIGELLSGDTDTSRDHFPRRLEAVLVQAETLGLLRHPPKQEVSPPEPNSVNRADGGAGGELVL